MAAPIKAGDSPNEKIAKLLPADVTAAFLSAKAGLIAGTGENASFYVFWTFVAVLVLSVFYFWFVSNVRNFIHICFLALTFIVFAVSIADVQFTAYFQTIFNSKNVEPIIRAISIVLPILWAFLISQIFVSALGDKVVTPGA